VALSLYDIKNNKQKKRGFKTIFSRIFKILQKSKTFRHKFDPDRFSEFDVYWKQTDRQKKTLRHPSKVYI